MPSFSVYTYFRKVSFTILACTFALSSSSKYVCAEPIQIQFQPESGGQLRSVTLDSNDLVEKLRIGVAKQLGLNPELVSLYYNEVLLCDRDPLFRYDMAGRESVLITFGFNSDHLPYSGHHPEFKITPLSLRHALENNDLSEASELLGQGADANEVLYLFQRDINGLKILPEGLLHQAIVEKKPELAKLLIQHGANPKSNIHSSVSSALLDATAFRQYEVMQALLIAGADANFGTPLGLTPFHLADLKGAQILWETGANPQIINTTMSENALQTAVRTKRSEVARFLLSKEMDPNRTVTFGASTSNRCSLLHYAILESDIPLIQALLAAGADLTSRDTDGRTPLDVAVRLNPPRPEIIELLRKTKLR
jgi:ankyrin repeat protein